MCVCVCVFLLLFSYNCSFLFRYEWFGMFDRCSYVDDNSAYILVFILIVYVINRLLNNNEDVSLGLKLFQSFWFFLFCFNCMRIQYVCLFHFEKIEKKRRLLEIKLYTSIVNSSKTFEWQIIWSISNQSLSFNDRVTFKCSFFF